MKIYITKTEADMLQDAIREWELGVYEMEEACEGSSAFSKKQLNAIQNVKEKLIKAHG